MEKGVEEGGEKKGGGEEKNVSRKWEGCYGTICFIER